jgi:hypothetical protein
VSHRSRVVVWMVGGRVDMAAANRTIAWLVSNGFSDSAAAAWERAYLEGRDFLHRCWPLIAAIADALLAAGRLDANEVESIVRRASARVSAMPRAWSCAALPAT